MMKPLPISKFNHSPNRHFGKGDMRNLRPEESPSQGGDLLFDDLKCKAIVGF